MSDSYCSVWLADEMGGKLPNRVIMFLDEYGTLPKIESAEMMFSASRSRRISIIAIIQSIAQLQKNYGKEGAEIIIDNCQLSIYGGFAPNSETAVALSKNLGERTVQSGSISHGRDKSQSLQMMGRSLMTVDEVKSMPKDSFIVTKTGFFPMKTFMRLFFKWGIVLDKDFVLPAPKVRKISYADKSAIEALIQEKYPPKEGAAAETETHDQGEQAAQSNIAQNDQAASTKPLTPQQRSAANQRLKKVGSAIKKEIDKESDGYDQQ